MADEQQQQPTRQVPIQDNNDGDDGEEFSTQGAHTLGRVVEVGDGDNYDDEEYGAGMQDDEDDDGLTMEQRIKLAKMLGFDISALYAQGAGDFDDDDDEDGVEDNSETFGTGNNSNSPPFRMGGFGSGGFMGFGSGGFGRMFVQSSSSEEEEEPKTIEEKRKRYRCGEKFYTLNDVLPWDQYVVGKKITNVKKNKRFYPANAELNQKISIWQGDSTTIEIDAIVNAANSSLLGGGGIDGAIHRAAGRGLYKECRTLKGCPTGYTKLTKGHKLPANYILHTVGPTDEDPKALRSCYETCFQLVEQHNIKTVAFCCVSTGIFGYPLRNATKIALDVTRKWMETNENYKKVDRIIFVVFLEKEQKVYEKMMIRYFPLPLTQEEADKEAQEKDEPAEASSEDEDARRPTFSWGMPSWASMQRPAQPTGGMFKTGAELYEERMKQMKDNYYSKYDDDDEDEDNDDYYMPIKNHPMMMQGHRVVIDDGSDEDDNEVQRGANAGARQGDDKRGSDKQDEEEDLRKL